MATSKSKTALARTLTADLVTYAMNADDDGTRETLDAAKRAGVLTFVRELIDESRRQIEDYTEEFGW